MRLTAIRKRLLEIAAEMPDRLCALTRNLAARRKGTPRTDNGGMARGGPAAYSRALGRRDVVSGLTRGDLELPEPAAQRPELLEVSPTHARFHQLAQTVGTLESGEGLAPQLSDLCPAPDGALEARPPASRRGFQDLEHARRERRMRKGRAEADAKKRGAPDNPAALGRMTPTEAEAGRHIYLGGAAGGAAGCSPPNRM